MNYLTQGGLKQQKCILSPPGGQQKEATLSLSSIWWLPAILGIPWCMNKSLQALPPQLHGVRPLSSAYVSESVSPHKESSHCMRVHSNQCNLIFP